MKFPMALLLITLTSLMACSHHPSHVPKQGHHHHHHPGDMNRKFMDPKMDVGQWKEDFESVERDVFKHRVAIVEALGLQPGDRVGDIGAGTGAFLSLLHNKVGPQGKVYAVEISPKFVNFMQNRARQDKLSSVEVVLGEGDTTKLPRQSVNTLLLVNVYHHFDHPQAMLQDLQRVLEPGGQLAIVDFARVPGESRPWILKHTRLTEEEHIQEISAEGFKFVEKKDIPFAENFMLVFRKS
jgi:predicted methyltransferase